VKKGMQRQTQNKLFLFKHTFDTQIITEEEGFLVHGIQGQENHVS
jgi:hypothetical protein